MGTHFNLASGARILAGLAIGAATSWAILNGSFGLVRIVWPEYAVAEPEKAYTLAMLFLRLAVYSSMIAGTASIAAIVARDRRLAWLAGGLILAFSIPPHVYPAYVWDDYPAWYHAVYILSILPISFSAGELIRHLFPNEFLARNGDRSPITT